MGGTEVSANWTGELAQYVVTTNLATGTGSLDEAIQAANATGGVHDLITLDTTAGGWMDRSANVYGAYTYSNWDDTTIMLTSTSGALTSITDDVTLAVYGAGGGVDVTIDGGYNRDGGMALSGYQIFNVTNSATLTLDPTNDNYGGTPGTDHPDSDTAGAPGTYLPAGYVGNTLTLKYGEASDGGAVFVDTGATLNAYDTNVLFNQASGDGGAIYLNDGATLNATNSQINANLAADEGGGIFANTGSAINLSDSNVSFNYATNGGGIYVTDGASVLIDYTTISGNYASGNGGGLFIDNTDVTIQNSSEIDDNEAVFNGGGIYNDGGTQGTLTIDDSFVRDNVAGVIPTPPGLYPLSGGNGGGIWNNDTLILTNGTEVSGNDAIAGYSTYVGIPYDPGNVVTGGFGGGIFNTGSNGTVSTYNTGPGTDVNISNNTAQYSGGGISLSSSNTTSGEASLADLYMDGNTAGFDFYGAGDSTVPYYGGNGGGIYDQNFDLADRVNVGLVDFSGGTNVADAGNRAFTLPQYFGQGDDYYPPAASTLTLIVTTENDVVDNDVSSIGALLTDAFFYGNGDGYISLREAILASNNDLTNSSTIYFDYPGYYGSGVSTITLTRTMARQEHMGIRMGLWISMTPVVS